MPATPSAMARYKHRWCCAGQSPDNLRAAHLLPLPHAKASQALTGGARTHDMFKGMYTAILNFGMMST